MNTPTLLTRRRTLTRAAPAAAAVALAAMGCGTAAGSIEGTQGATKAGTGPYTLTWGIRTGATPEDVEGVIKAYRTAHPNVTIEQFSAPGGTQASLEKLATGVASGVPFDVITGHAYALHLIGALDILQPIEDLVKSAKLDTGKYNKNFLESAGRYQGKLYALPYAYGGNVVGAVFNRGLFAAAGVPAPSSDWNKPWTWDEFQQAMRQLTKSDGGKQTQVGAASFGNYITTTTMDWEAQWIADDFKTAVCDSPQTIDAYTRYADLLFKSRVFAQSPGADLGSGNVFLNGKAGITMFSASALAFAKSTANTAIDWGFITMPKGKISSLDLAPTILALAKTAKNRAEAWEFLRFLDDNSRLSAIENRMPADILDAEAWIKNNFAPWPNSNAAMLNEGTRIARAADPIIRHPQGQKMIGDVLDPGWKDVTDEKTTVADFLRACKPRLQQMLDDYARNQPKN